MSPTLDCFGQSWSNVLRPFFSSAQGGEEQREVRKCCARALCENAPRSTRSSVVFFPIFFNGLSKSSVTVSDVRISLCGARPVADGGINLENRGTKNHIMLHFSSTFVGIYCFRMFSTSKNIASNSYINTKER